MSDLYAVHKRKKKRSKDVRDIEREKRWKIIKIKKSSEKHKNVKYKKLKTHLPPEKWIQRDTAHIDAYKYLLVLYDFDA